MVDQSGNARFSICLGQDVPVGTLWLNRARGRVTSTFVYAQSWLQSPEHFELGPDLPLDDSPKSTDGLFFCFRDCSPDRWGRGIVARMERACAAAGHRAPATMLESDFLLRTNDVTRQGALRISKAMGTERLANFGEGSVPPLTRLHELCEAVLRYCEKRESLAELSLLAACASSSGGARPKAGVLGAENELLLAKFPAPDDDRDMPLGNT